jgi:ubiquinol-cytochrome c reductase cytochrome c1 subunit
MGPKGRIFAGLAGIIGLCALAVSARAVDTNAKGSAYPLQAEGQTPPRQAWSFHGPLGKFDQAQLQRGFQVYHQVCSTCHSLNLVAFRDLAQAGGPGFSEDEVKALAATYQIEDGPNEQGQMFKRPGRPSDRFPPPFANPEAAKAVFGAAPPDMSDLAKARGFPRPFPLFILDAVMAYQEQGPDYIVAILNGFTHPDDPNWNLYFPGHHIAMPKPLNDGAIKYTDGTAPTLANYSRDVAAFLFWAAEPKLEERKAMGFRVVVFLIVFAGLLYFTKKRIWSDVQGH